MFHKRTRIERIDKEIIEGGTRCVGNPRLVTGNVRIWESGIVLQTTYHLSIKSKLLTDIRFQKVLPVVKETGLYPDFNRF